MATINRMRADWASFTGAPGVSTFYSLAPETDIVALGAFFLAQEPHLPAGLTIVMEGFGDQISDVDGSLLGSWAAPVPSSTLGSSNTGYAAPAGCVIDWLTNVVVDGSRVVGRTFLVPLSNSSYDPEGTLNNTILAAIQTSADNLIAASAGNLVVWHRPRKSPVPPSTLPPHAGSHAVITGSRVRDKVAVLRSRRD